MTVCWLHLPTALRRGCTSQQQFMTQVRAYILMCMLNMSDFPLHKVRQQLTLTGARIIKMHISNRRFEGFPLKSSQARPKV